MSAFCTLSFLALVSPHNQERGLLVLCVRCQAMHKAVNSMQGLNFLQRYTGLEIPVSKIDWFHFAHTNIVLKPVHWVHSSPYCLYKKSCCSHPLMLASGIGVAPASQQNSAMVSSPSFPHSCRSTWKMLCKLVKRRWRTSYRGSMRCRKISVA